MLNENENTNPPTLSFDLNMLANMIMQVMKKEPSDDLVSLLLDTERIVRKYSSTQAKKYRIERRISKGGQRYYLSVTGSGKKRKFSYIGNMERLVEFLLHNQNNK